MKKMPSISSAIGMALVLTGCVTSEQVDNMLASATPATSKERKIIVDYVRETFKDPYTLRDTEISYFFVNSKGHRTGCISLNGKNSFGAYIGKSEMGIQIAGGDSVVYAVQDDIGCKTMTDRGIRWQKFPELEAI